MTPADQHAQDRLQRALAAEFSAMHDVGYGPDLGAATREVIAARKACETIDERCFRLGLEAAALDKRAEDELAEAAQDDLVVKVRRERWGDDDVTALNIAGRASAARSLAADYTAEAKRLRDQAASLRKALVSVVRAA